MIILQDNFERNIDINTFIALGNFDGLHIGHMSLINKTRFLAKLNHSKSMVYFFKNHPLNIINKEYTPKLITSNEAKIDILRKAKVDIVNIVNFDKNFMKISPKDFIYNLIKNYKAKGFVVGFNYRFGYRNLGDTDLLLAMSKAHDFSVNIMEPVCINNEVISSSRIRNYISDGNIKHANIMLGRPFMLEGQVIRGKQIGRTIGFPTINLDYNKDFILPRGGVYYTFVNFKNCYYKAITNIGYNPTVSGGKLNIESHIIDFHYELYDEHVKIYFIERIRDEKKFENLKELKEQLKKDKLYAINNNFKFTF